MDLSFCFDKKFKSQRRRQDQAKKQTNKQNKNKTKNKTIGFSINKQNMRRPLNYHGFVCRLKFFFT